MLCLGEGEAHEQGVVAGVRGGGLPGAPRTLEAAPPAQELALGGDPLAQLAPALEDRFVGDLRIGLALFGRGGDEQAMRMVGELGHLAPFFLGNSERGARRRVGSPSSRTVASLSVNSRRSFSSALGLAGEECVRTLGQDAAELHRLRRQAQYAVATTDHVGPHVVEEIGQQRQRPGIAGRFLRGAAPEILGQLFAFEPRREQRGRPAEKLRDSAASRNGGTLICR